MFDYLKELNDEALVDELIPARDQIAEAGPAGYLVAVVEEIAARGLDFLLTDDDRSYLPGA